MDTASALIKQVITLSDVETWSYVRKEYLPHSYHKVHERIDSYLEKYHKFPTFEALIAFTREARTQEKIYAIQANNSEQDPSDLLSFLKNEYTQSLILTKLDKYVEHTALIADANESVEALHQIILDVEDEVDLEDPSESMQTIDLFEPDEEIGRYLALGLNSEYDHNITFSPRDLILVGGRRGAGKSVTCANIANNVYEQGRSSIYFTIEMDSRSILQRICATATQIPFSRLRAKNLSIVEWEKVATWWANRYVDGNKRLKEYQEHRDFVKLHKELKTKHALNDPSIQVVYDPSLTLATIKSKVDTIVKQQKDVGVIVVDYMNQVKRSHHSSNRGGQYDWTEQIEVSKALKSLAQEYEIPVFSPYQTDATGEARFAKGILDAADAAYALETWSHEDACMTFNCVKMRNASMDSFSSVINWDTLKIGPETAITPKEKDSQWSSATGEPIDDL